MALEKRQTPLSINIKEEKEEKPVKKVAPKKAKVVVEAPIEVAKPVSKRVNPLQLEEANKEKIVEVPKEVIKVVEKIVEVPKEVIKEVEKIVEVPKEVIKEVEKIVEVPKEVIKVVEKVVEVPKEVIKEVEKIVEVEKAKKELPNLPSCNKNSLVIGFARKDVMSILKSKGLSSKEILNKAIESLLKEQYEEDYLKLAKGE